MGQLIAVRKTNVCYYLSSTTTNQHQPRPAYRPTPCKRTSSLECCQDHEKKKNLTPQDLELRSSNAHLCHFPQLIQFHLFPPRVPPSAPPPFFFFLKPLPSPHCQNTTSLFPVPLGLYSNDFIHTFLHSVAHRHPAQYRQGSAEVRPVLRVATRDTCRSRGCSNNHLELFKRSVNFIFGTVRTWATLQCLSLILPSCSAAVSAFLAASTLIPAELRLALFFH